MQEKKPSQNAVDALNQAFSRDPEAISNLLAQRVTCNEGLADDPHVQVAESKGQFTLSAIGLINGVMVSIGAQKIAARFDDKTEKLIGFCLYEEPSPSTAGK